MVDAKGDRFEERRVMVIDGTNHLEGDGVSGCVFQQGEAGTSVINRVVVSIRAWPAGS
jgi:hypothetical protein